jgi:uncharacterized lipoprotein NlpE involved in copper resistance
MKRKAFFSLVMVVFGISGLSSCLSNSGAVDSHNSRNSLDWAGVYTGTIPSASGSGINVSMKLNKDNTYELTYDYIDRPASSFTFTGSFSWDNTGNNIHIEIADAPSYYRVGENKLIQLDMEGKLITGNLADMYVLTKQR